ncbi:CRISPR-associated protein Cas4 [Dehalococcoides mccartyi]|uniref:CRISPR-associated exonuclease Cas4 n=1 Tax=Dehalococcoides mccartyi TaxID=61435 RepID=A0A0V8M554_9CHLR|nr:CRISPR-associated protein Cas4 [Dehalococcoides mccartyi]AGG05732.1 CRISPR-associated RecB family exonuclease Cas4b [Dehalococcoides mccartyi DCMB5]AQW61975.1 CRISPR-associated protein Cas4 [Dehalococcoides mccartyi]KSV18899.1 CRISPR-associated protein Cas4 [Dehalococcoides mccartyi]
MPYSEEELISISALQHLAFCPRQAGLIYIAGQWQDNPLTFEGTELHKSAHQPQSQSRSRIIISHSLYLRSLKLGLVGMADIVEFHPKLKAEGGVKVASQQGYYFPHIVEYKRGNLKLDNCDLVQVCAQAICLEEMLGVAISEAEIFYGQPRRRHKVTLNLELRNQTARLAEEMHELIETSTIPPAKYKPGCKKCSLSDICAPEIGLAGSAKVYLTQNLKEALNETPA